LKVQLKLSISRLRMVQQRDEALAKQQRRAMAQLLEVSVVILIFNFNFIFRPSILP
jgi:vacuolar protein sorting-associated protein IST1